MCVSLSQIEFIEIQYISANTRSLTSSAHNCNDSSIPPTSRQLQCSMESNVKYALKLGVKLNYFLIVPILALVVALSATFIAIIIILWIHPYHWLGECLTYFLQLLQYLTDFLIYIAVPHIIYIGFCGYSSAFFCFRGSEDVLHLESRVSQHSLNRLNALEPVMYMNHQNGGFGGFRGPEQPRHLRVWSGKFIMSLHHVKHSWEGETRAINVAERENLGQTSCKHTRNSAILSEKPL